MNATEIGETLLTLKDIQKHCKLSLRMLQRKIQEGELEILRFGRSIRVEPKAYAKFLANARENTKCIAK
jgi:hypothetical protein